jgi:hypothetical protein
MATSFSGYANGAEYFVPDGMIEASKSVRAEFL